MRLFKKTIITRLGDTSEKPVPYLIRWSLLTTPWFTIKLHKILISDDDCLHDHPWSFISIILWGGYVEETWYAPYIGRNYLHDLFGHSSNLGGRIPTTKRLYGAGSILYRPNPWPHRLDVFQPAWTLVFTSGKQREWGFWGKEKWIPWYKYSPQNKCE